MSVIPITIQHLPPPVIPSVVEEQPPSWAIEAVPRLYARDDTEATDTGDDDTGPTDTGAVTTAIRSSTTGL
jgi:hypothetical protein